MIHLEESHTSTLGYLIFISCVFFFNHGLVYFLINIYSDLLQLALKYFKDTEININNVLIMINNFNIRGCSWNSDFRFHSLHKDTFINIADTFHLELSILTNHVPTRYLDNQWDSNSVIDLMFLKLDSSEHNNHSIHLEWYLTSNHAPFSVDIAIFEENIQTKKHIIIKDSEEEDNFVSNLIKAIKGLNMDNIQSKESLEYIVQTFADCIERI